MTASILLIDDDISVLRVLGSFFEQHGWDVYRELSGEAGIATFERVLPDVVFVDLHLPGMDGLDVLGKLYGRETAVVVLTGDADVPTAVRAVQSGAENFLTKPVNLSHVQGVADRAAEKVHLRRVNRMLIGQGANERGVESLGTSPLMREVARQVTTLAHGERNLVLIQGESGTGKRWIARMLHELSPRAAVPFLEFACGGGDAQWLGTELFGREVGDGVGERRQGLLEVADGGSLLLEEIGDLPLPLQGRLEGVIANRAVRRSGASREMPIDIRFIATTSRPLADEVSAGRFRADLYSRFNVMPITAPPLRDRTRDDLLSLIRRFLAELAATMPGSPTVLSDDALDRLLRYSWPGNVRELRNVLERGLLLARGNGQIGAEHLPPEFRARTAPFDRRHTPLTLDELERMHIDRTLKHHDGNRTHAAQELGISRATLIAKIKRYALPG